MSQAPGHPIKLVIAGVAGRMGARIAELAAGNPDFEIIYGLEAQAKAGLLPKPASTYANGSDSAQIEKADVLIDFTLPAATLSALVPMIRKYRKSYVIGTTGFIPEQEAVISELAKEVPIVKSSNMSIGVNVFFQVAQQIARTLPDYAVCIQETHHVHKKDAPSGTALQVGRLIENVTGKTVKYESFREKEVVGDHRITFEGKQDRIELFHHAESRDIFAAGALQAAQWVVHQKPGLYTMQDVLGFHP